MRKTVPAAPARPAPHFCALAALGLLLALGQAHAARAQWATGNGSTTTGDRVGIGTADPSLKLHVRTGSAGVAPPFFSGYDALLVEGDMAPIIQLLGPAHGSGWVEFSRAGASALRGRGAIGYDFSNDSLNFFTANDGSFGDSFNRLKITSSGNVGIGTANPSYKLEVNGVARTPAGLVVGTELGDYVSGATQYHMAQVVANGTKSPLVLMGGSGAVEIWKDTPVTKASAFGMGVPGTAIGNDLIFSTYSAAAGWLGRLTVSNGGNVGVGTTAPAERLHVEGNLKVTGNIEAKYQDVAEWVPSVQKLAAGTVVILDPSRSNHVLASASSYDTAVAGVVSAQPGLILGEGGEGKVMVATTGRVRVRVDATKGAIKIGDLLVTSDVAGVAMKSEAVSLGGVTIHRPGTIIGKALEPLAGGVGEILVLLSLQ